tara:strand:+ start:24869 stop:25867 length:999 start_codon:yes stop_codon:yes gene_type:complete
MHGKTGISGAIVTINVGWSRSQSRLANPFAPIVPELLVTAALRIFHGDSDSTPSLRVGSRLDKYRLLRRLGEGGFATVFSAVDTIEDRKVALKIPDSRFVSNTQTMDDMQREVRIMAKLQHPGVLTLKDARFIDGYFVIVSPLGDETLADRITRRLARATCVQYIHQMVDAVAYAHENRVLHRDIKPENFILFPDSEIRLTDFGLARLESGAHEVSASGTLGYMAPEQAMGKPTFRSDVFSLGLIMYRMLAGELPEYPFAAPLPGYQKLRRGLSSDFVKLIRKAIDPTPSKRFRDAVAMNNALQKIRSPLSDRSATSRGAAKNNRGSTRRVA